MVKRLLNCSPKEMLALKPRELKEAIRLSEGRTVHVLARVSAPNLVQYVSNPEVAAAFGADMVGINAYDPTNPLFPGIPSKDPKNDEATRNLLIQIGKGWTLREVRELIGRPVSIHLEVPPGYGEEKIGEELVSVDVKTGRVTPGMLFTKENAELAISQGPDIFSVGGRGRQEEVVRCVGDAKKVARDRCLLAAGVEHLLGSTIGGKKPYDLRKLITPETVKSLAEAGADIIQIPAAGCFPGYDISYVHKLFDVIHEYNCLAEAGLQWSQEGTDTDTIKRLAINNKMAGMDILNLGDAGLNENIPLPENIMAVCIAIKGRRHTYRRMAESILR